MSNPNCGNCGGTGQYTGEDGKVWTCHCIDPKIIELNNPYKKKDWGRRLLRND